MRRLLITLLLGLLVLAPAAPVGASRPRPVAGKARAKTTQSHGSVKRQVTRAVTKVVPHHGGHIASSRTLRSGELRSLALGLVAGTRGTGQTRAGKVARQIRPFLRPEVRLQLGGSSFTPRTLRQLGSFLDDHSRAQRLQDLMAMQ